MHGFGLSDFFGLFAFLLAQIRDNHAQGVALVSPKPVQRHMDRNHAPVARAQVEFAFRNTFLSLCQECSKSVPLFSRKQRMNRHPDYFSRWFANHFRELAVRIQHGAVARKSGRAFAHSLYQHPIGGLSAFQFYQLLALPAQNHQSIHFAGLDGGQSFLRCFQPGAKFLLGHRFGIDGAGFLGERLRGLSARLSDTCYSAFCFSTRQDIQPHQRTLSLGEVPNDFFDRGRQPSHQGWNGDDLVALCQLRLLEQVDDFNPVLALQLILTNLL